MRISHRRFTMPSSWGRKLAAFALFAAIFLSAIAVHAKSPASFAGIQLGMAEKSIPSALQADAFKMSYRGVLDGDYMEVGVYDGRVSGFQVTYFGKNQKLDLISKPMTLRQAVARHSAGSPKAPVFAKAVSRGGIPTGLADTANIIMYYTGGSTSPSAQVQYVYYANPDAPFANVKKSQLLSNSEVAELRREESTVSVKGTAPVSVTPAGEYLKASTREAALNTIQMLADETLGTGRRVDALIDHAESWLSVDPRHSEARQTFCDLSTYSVRFTNSYKSLMTAYVANQSLLGKADIEVFGESVEMKNKIERRMRQVRAMGYDASLCLM